MAGKAATYPRCVDSRKCHAKTTNIRGQMICLCLTYPRQVGKHRGVIDTNYKDGQCPFCKPVANVTKGKVYPHDITCTSDYSRTVQKSK